MKFHPSGTPEVDRLGVNPDSWADLIASFSNLVVEIENRAARAVGVISRIERAPTGNGLMDLAGGFHADLNLVSEGYAIASNDSINPDPRVEFDFPDHPGLVRLWDIFHPDRRNLSTLIAALFSEEQLSLKALEERRYSETPPRPRCPCCEENAAERARYASMHPLFDILMSSTRRTDPLQLRVLSPFAELSTPLLPYQVEAANGILTAIDKDNSSAFHLDVRWLHAMRIKLVGLDGTSYALLIGYDSFGGEMFHLASPDPADVDEWTRSCEWSMQFFAK